jgi:hypothetical protein
MDVSRCDEFVLECRMYSCPIKIDSLAYRRLPWHRKVFYTPIRQAASPGWKGPFHTVSYRMRIMVIMMIMASDRSTFQPPLILGKLHVTCLSSSATYRHCQLNCRQGHLYIPALQHTEHCRIVCDASHSATRTSRRTSPNCNQCSEALTNATQVRMHPWCSAPSRRSAETNCSSLPAVLLYISQTVTTVAYLLHLPDEV